jgi:hypothetical protein
MDCLCGCGQQPIKKDSKYLHGHWAKTEDGRRHLGELHFKNSRCDHGDGYKTVSLRNGKGHVLEHRVVAGVIGTKLVIHHIDGDRSNNHPSNLQILPDIKSHRLIHQREKARKICGYPDWRKCSLCGQYDDPKNLYIPPNRGTIAHKKCISEYNKNYMEKKRGKING